VVAYAMLALTLIPILDGLIVFKHSGWIFKPAILIHWGTATLMLINRRAVAKWNVANRSTGGNRAMHVSIPATPQNAHRRLCAHQYPQERRSGYWTEAVLSLLIL
jgi:hypothetical protein